MKDLQVPSIQTEMIVEQTSSAAADDSPDHQILMAPRTPKLTPGIDNAITETNTENSSIDTKKDIWIVTNYLELVKYKTSILFFKRMLLLSVHLPVET